MKRWILIIFCLSVFHLYGDVTFGGLHLSESDQLLFSADATGPLYGDYRTMFQADLPGQSMQQLTFFPERVVLLENGTKFQIENRFGIFRTDENFQNLHSVKEFPAFENGKEIQNGKISNVEASPDGLYLLYYRPVNYSYADLVLFSVKEQQEVVISTENEFSLDNKVARWSPDSEYFIYSNKGALYYFSIDQYENSRIIAEDFRSIGEGGIASVKWSSRNDLYYIHQYRVYKINSAEFFTQSIYSGLFGIGTMIGKVPFTFDRNFDSFDISPDGQKILLNRGGRNLFLYFLKTDDYRSTGDIKSLPYLFLPRNTNIKRVIWSGNDLITILASSVLNGKFESSIFRIDLISQEESLTFTQTDELDVEDIVLAEDEKNIALMRKDGVEIKNYTSWTYIRKFEHSGPYHIMWKNNEEIIISGSYYTELTNAVSGESRIITLSQPGDYGYGQDGYIYTSSLGNTYQQDENEEWVSVNEKVEIKSPAVSSLNKRVYLEQSSTGSYENMIMVRDIKGYGTKTLFAFPEKQYEPFPDEEDPWDLQNFTHGSRIRRREVSLVFNAVDSVEGLTEILNILTEYNIRTTFFLNGEFMRRNPEAVKELSLSGHEIGSMFYIYFNMTDAKFKIDEEFIKRGLARNEDDYFLLTGKELSLLWHSPYYFVNSEIIRASASMDYAYIGRDVDPLDWVPLSDCTGDSMYLSTMDVIEKIMSDKKQGSIIPIRIGQTVRGRDDYLFQNLDLLINGLLSQGYDIVPVSTLREHVQ
ncbi:MAG: polysaccharide deacetylase family protein [Spirochaetales bacterium]|nr:polysaccharide deacetylase family protein [Spirochaetales bacterium]